MADTYTSLLRFIMQEPLSNVNKWGSVFNAAVTDLVEEAIAGKSVINLSFSDAVLIARNGSSDQSRPMFIEAIGNPGTVRDIVVPNLTKLYVFQNSTSPTVPVQLKTATSDPISVSLSQSPTLVFVDSANDSLHTLGRSDGIPDATPWTEIELFEEDEAGVVVTAEYSVQGDFTTLYIPSFQHLFSGTIMALRAESPTGTLPTALQWTASIEVGYPTWIIDDSFDEENVEDCVLLLSSASSRIQWQKSAGGVFADSVGRQLPYNASYTFPTKS